MSPEFNRVDAFERNRVHESNRCWDFHLGDSTAEPEPNLRAALDYAAVGWAVLPIHEVSATGICACGIEECRSPGKHPRTTHGLSDATRDPDTIASYWNQWPQANIGVATGMISRLITLNIDPRHSGDDSLGLLRAAHGSEILETLTQLTGGGGRHLSRAE